MRRAAGFFAVQVAFTSLLVGNPAHADATEPATDAAITTLPIALHVATEHGAPVADDAWIHAALAEANRIYAPARIAFDVRTRDTYDSPITLETRDDRNRLGAKVSLGLINWFVTKSLRDVDEPDRMRRGVHWRANDAAGVRRHFVIVSILAGPSVLAHELGHFFGNKHSPVPGNIMSYERTEDPPAFDTEQLARIRRVLRACLRSGEIRLKADRRGVAPRAASERLPLGDGDK
ncbi:MAG: hypothetical protein R3A78_07755 [Polyangiales bacterium]|nr:hypothetical protein [Myxococcales bacterium]